METKTTRAQELLNRVYDHLKSIDIEKMSMRDLQEFVEVLQKAHFLESYGKNTFPTINGFGGFGGPGSLPTLTKPPASETDTRQQEDGE